MSVATLFLLERAVFKNQASQDRAEFKQIKGLAEYKSGARALQVRPQFT